MCKKSFHEPSFVILRFLEGFTPAVCTADNNDNNDTTDISTDRNIIVLLL